MQYLSKSAYNTVQQVKKGISPFDTTLLKACEQFQNNIPALFDFVNCQYTYFTKTPLDFMDKDYILVENLPDNYLRLYHNTTKISCSKDLYRILTVRCYFRKVMKPYININEMLFNAYIDNKLIGADPFHVAVCANIVQHVYEANDIPEDIKKRIEEKIQADRPEICVFKPNIKSEDRMKIIEMILRDRIAQTYNPDLTDNENAKNAGVCLNTFKKWAKANGNTKQDRMQKDIDYVRQHFDYDMTIKANFEQNPLIIAMGISFSTFKNILKRMKQQDKETQPAACIEAPYHPETTEDKQTAILACPDATREPEMSHNQLELPSDPASLTICADMMNFNMGLCMPSKSFSPDMTGALI